MAIHPRSLPLLASVFLLSPPLSAAGPSPRFPASLVKIAALAPDEAPEAPKAGPVQDPEALTDAEIAALKSQWVEQMRSMDETWAHGTFLKAGRMSLDVVDPWHFGLRKALAGYSEDHIRVNRDFLNLAKKSLLSQGVGRESLVEVLAAKTLSLIVHEVRHGLTARGIRKATGMEFKCGLIEDEVLAYMDKLRAINALSRKRPGLASYKIPWERTSEKNIKFFGRKGIDAVDGYVREFSKVDSVFTSSREDMIADYRDIENEFQGIVKDLTETGASQDLEGAELLTNASEVVARTAASIEFLSDPARFEALKAFFKARYIEEGSKRWEGERK
jgi:hypothetical protein